MVGSRRASKASQSQQNSVPDDLCPCCKDGVADNDFAVQCEYCDGWFHAKCANIPDSIVKAVTAVNGFKYFCSKCTPSVDRLLTLEQRMTVMEAKFDSLSGKLANFSTLPTHLPNPPKQNSAFNNTAPKSFNEAVEEAMELKLKSRNAVLFGVPESSRDDDLDSVRRLLSTPTDQGVEQVKPSDVVYVFRDGPRREGQHRFLKVVCTTNQVRQNFIMFINKVAKAASGLPLRARPDLTYQQRSNGRKLREKLEELGAEDHYINYQKGQIFSKTTKKSVYSLIVM